MNLDPSPFGGRRIKRHKFESFAGKRDPNFLRKLFRMQNGRCAQQLKNQNKKALHFFFPSICFLLQFRNYPSVK